jgi:hypothetical protein
VPFRGDYAKGIADVVEREEGMQAYRDWSAGELEAHFATGSKADLAYKAWVKQFDTQYSWIVETWWKASRWTSNQKLIDDWTKNHKPLADKARQDFIQAAYNERPRASATGVRTDPPGFGDVNVPR